MTNILLVDIDHTLSDAAWRDDMIQNNDWDAYHLAGKDDKPIEEVIQLINTLCWDNAGESSCWEIIGVTARPEKWRKQTMDWLMKSGCHIDEILMRPDNAFRSAGDMKVELLRKRFGDNLEQLAGCNVIFIDDNEKVIEAIRGLGITTMQVAAAKRK